MTRLGAESLNGDGGHLHPGATDRPLPPGIGQSPICLRHKLEP